MTWTYSRKKDVAENSRKCTYFSGICINYNFAHHCDLSGSMRTKSLKASNEREIPVMPTDKPYTGSSAPNAPTCTYQDLNLLANLDVLSLTCVIKLLNHLGTILNIPWLTRLLGRVNEVTNTH